MAQTVAAKEAIWLRQLLQELSPTNESPYVMIIYADNQGAIALAKDPKFHARTKHIALRHHFIREKVVDGDIELEFDLLTQRDPDTNEPLYPPGRHVVWLDNLFTSVKLLTRLREEGIGGAGTVRTTRTKREELGDSEGDILINARGGKKKIPTEQIDERLSYLKLHHTAQLPWGVLYGATSKDSKVMEFAWKDAQVVLFMSTVNNGKRVTPCFSDVSY